MTRLMRGAAMLVAAGLLAGCAAWPTEGTGGLAELDAPASPRLAALDLRLRRLETSPLRNRAAADIVEARTLLTRAEREHVGGLPEDAEVNAAAAERAITVAEARQRGIGRLQPTPPPGA